MPDEINKLDALEDRTVRLRRVIEHADESIASWSPEKHRDATLTFYSRSTSVNRDIVSPNSNCANRLAR
jgi:hypothetical protein